MRANLEKLLIICLLILGAAARVYFYGDLRLSLGNQETQGYIDSSKASLFSWKSFAGQRLFTTNLIYKLANNPDKCKLTEISYPASDHGVNPALQPCFDQIALLQNLLGIFGWCFLAWTTSRWLIHFAPKIGIVILILGFAFTPQIAEWDGLLSPESLSLTLLVISFGVLQEIVFCTLKNKDKFISIKNILLIVVWVIVFILWVFVRDVQLYTIPITISLLALLLLFKDFRKTKIVEILIVILIGFFILGYVSAKDGLRATRYAVEHAYDTFIYPYPKRVEFFNKFGMPDQKSPIYQQWFDNNATKLYAYFLLSHPGFVVTTIWNNLNFFKAGFVQPYFKGINTKDRPTLLSIGELIHPETTAVYLIDSLLIIILCLKAISQSKTSIIGWTWLAAWFFLSSMITLLVSFFGDAEGILRHIMPSVESLRLFMWIFLFVLIDGFLNREASEIIGNQIP